MRGRSRLLQEFKRRSKFLSDAVNPSSSSSAQRKTAPEPSGTTFDRLLLPRLVFESIEVVDALFCLSAAVSWVRGAEAEDIDFCDCLLNNDEPDK